MPKLSVVLSSGTFLAAAFLAAILVPSASQRAGADCPRLQDEKAMFAGADSCKKCHFKQHSSWKKTAMATTFEKLKPDVAVDVKTKFKLDPKKDYTKDAACVACHTTGYGLPGGYPALPAEGKSWTEDEAKLAKSMESVQCEACHGPGSLTNVFKKDNEDYKRADIFKKGMHAADKASCEKCHNGKGPTTDKDAPFDFEKAKADPAKLHAHVELKKKHE